MKLFSTVLEIFISETASFFCCWCECEVMKKQYLLAGLVLLLWLMLRYQHFCPPLLLHHKHKYQRRETRKFNSPFMEFLRGTFRGHRGPCQHTSWAAGEDRNEKSIKPWGYFNLQRLGQWGGSTRGNWGVANEVKRHPGGLRCHYQNEEAYSSRKQAWLSVFSICWRFDIWGLTDPCWSAPPRVTSS